MDIFFSCTFVLFPSLLFIVGLLSLLNLFKIYSTYLLAEGEIIRLKRLGRNIHPIVEYLDQNRKTYVFESLAYAPSWNEVGKKVQVLYNPEKSEDAIIKSWNNWVMPIGFLVIATPFICFLLFQLGSLF